MADPVLVFDLDGTLIDTAPDLLDSLNHCLVHLGLKPASPLAMRRFVGHGGRVMITRAMTEQGRMPTETDLDDILPVFLEHYGSGMPGKSLPYPGALDAIERFSVAGYKIAICTNKYQHLSDALIEGLGLTERFASICGADRFDFRKPDPRHLTETIALTAGNPEKSILVGDSRTDIDTAKAAGIPIVAVDWGYTDLPVSHYQPTTIISHFDELTLDLADRLVAEK